jgi:hypothetical protein
MEKEMSTNRLPNTDSIEELARFWDTHDATDFEDQLEEVSEPVFKLDGTITLRLSPDEAETVRHLANSKGVAESELIRSWVLEKLQSV